MTKTITERYVPRPLTREERGLPGKETPTERRQKLERLVHTVRRASAERQERAIAALSAALGEAMGEGG